MTSNIERCLYCQSYLSQDLSWRQLFSFAPLTFNLLCSSCQQGFKPFELSEYACKGCSLHLQETKWQDKGYCENCWQWVEKGKADLLNHHILYEYSDLSQEWLKRYKYQGDVRLAEMVVERVKEYKALHPNAQWVVVAHSPQKLLERKIHTTAMLLDRAGIAYACPFDYSQEGQMKWNGQGVDINGATFILFDDVYASGKTMMSAKEILLSAMKNSKTTIQSVSLFRKVLEEFE